MQTRNSVHRVLAFVGCESKCCVSDIKMIKITLGKKQAFVYIRFNSRSYQRNTKMHINCCVDYFRKKLQMQSNPRGAICSLGCVILPGQSSKRTRFKASRLYRSAIDRFFDF